MILFFYLFINNLENVINVVNYILIHYIIMNGANSVIQNTFKVVLISGQAKIVKWINFFKKFNLMQIAQIK